METLKFRLTGDYRDLEGGFQYTIAELSISSGIKLESLRERLARRGFRHTVSPADLDPVGQYRAVIYRLDSDAEVLSQQWLRKPIVPLPPLTKWIGTPRA